MIKEHIIFDVAVKVTDKSTAYSYELMLSVKARGFDHAAEVAEAAVRDGDSRELRVKILKVEIGKSIYEVVND